MNTSLRVLGMGMLLGAALSGIGFSSWDEVHAMFTFSDLRLFLTFVSAVAILFVAFRVLGRFRTLPNADKPFHKGTIPGAVLFGVGWAISGACPSIAFVQLGQGQLGAVFAALGMIVGNATFAYLNPRVLKVPATSCAES